MAPAGEDGWQEVRGESNYQRALFAAGLGKTPGGARRTVVIAELVREPENKYDRDAVRVDVDGSTVGYIPAEEASDYHDVLRWLASEGKRATCIGLITGGWDRGAPDQGSFGIILDCTPAPRYADAPFIPGEKTVLVADVADGVEEASLFGNKHQVETVATLARDGDRIKAFLGSTPLGWATPHSSAPLFGLLERVASAGYPTTCACVLGRPSKTAKRSFDAHVLVPQTKSWRFGDE